MAGEGPPPALPGNRRRRNRPVGGEWQPTTTAGWRGPVPPPPDGVLPATADAWASWFGAWFAAHWTTADLPALRLLAQQFDQVMRGASVARLTELRYWLDGYGITPRGRQQRRWLEPDADRPAPKTRRAAAPYGHLRVIDPAQQQIGQESDRDPRRAS